MHGISNLNPELRCCFCNSLKLKLQYKNKFHSFKKDHGPINFYICMECGSGLTIPLPDARSLENLYASFDCGMSKFTRDIRQRNSLSRWYIQCVERGLSYNSAKYNVNASFRWIDIGAGNGEVARILCEKFPKSKGVAVDFHERPRLLDGCENIEWRQCDLNGLEFYKKLEFKPFDVVLSITVIEHVLSPMAYIQNMVKLMAPSGSLYLTTPDMGSIASKALNRFWPYLIFGEHLNIPSKKGMRKLIEHLKIYETCKVDKSYAVRPVVLPYPITYYLDHFHLRPLSRLFSKNFILKVNTGILEAAIY